MGRGTRFTVAGVVSLAAAVAPSALLSACDDGEKINPAYPIEGGPEVRPKKDVTPPEDVVLPPPPVEAAACEVTGTAVEVRSVLADPNPTPIGGMVPDGTYVLTSAVYADGDAGVAFKRVASMKFTGKEIVWSYDTDEDGRPRPTCCAGTWAYNASDLMTLNVKCNGQEQLFGEFYDVYPDGMAFADAGPDSGVDAGAAQLVIHVGALHDIYTKH